jgi:hypothetical protein
VEADGVNGRVRFDGHTLLIERKGRLLRRRKRRGQTAISIATLPAVGWKPPERRRGYIQFIVLDREWDSFVPGTVTADAAGTNTVHFRKSQEQAFEALRNAVQTAITVHRLSRSPHVADVVATTAALHRLGQLRDRGELTTDEFAAQTAKLLGT